MSQHCKANPCCGNPYDCEIPLPQLPSGLVSHNKDTGTPTAVPTRAAIPTLTSSPEREEGEVKPVVIIGWHTIKQLLAGNDVETSAVTMLPASDLASAPTTPSPDELERLRERVAVLERGLQAALQTLDVYAIPDGYTDENGGRLAKITADVIRADLTQHKAEEGR